MDIITRSRKQEIAKMYLVVQQKKKHKISKKNVSNEIFSLNAS
jgi:ATP-dependent Lon protease